MLAPTSLLGKFVKFYKVSLGKVCEFTPPAPYASKCPVPRYHHGHVDKRPSVLDVKRCQMRGPAANNPQEPRRTPWNCRGKIPFKNNGEKILGTGRFFFWKKSSTTCNLMFFFGWMWMRWEHYSFLLKSFLFFFVGIDFSLMKRSDWWTEGARPNVCVFEFQLHFGSSFISRKRVTLVASLELISCDRTSHRWSLRSMGQNTAAKKSHSERMRGFKTFEHNFELILLWNLQESSLQNSDIKTCLKPLRAICLM